MHNPVDRRGSRPPSEAEGGIAQPWRAHLVTGPKIAPPQLTYKMTTPLHEYHSYQGNTNDCGPHSICIVANALLGERRFDPSIVAQELNRPTVRRGPLPHIVVRRIPNWATFPWGITDFLNRHGFTAKWHLRGNADRLQDNLRADLATMVVIGEPFRFVKGKYVGWGHVKVLSGYDALHGYAFVDPGSRKDPSDRWERIGIFWQEETSFSRQWARLLRVYIEVSLQE